MARRIVRVAIAQAAPVFLNLEESVEKAVRLTAEAAAKGARNSLPFRNRGCRAIPPGSICVPVRLPGIIRRPSGPTPAWWRTAPSSPAPRPIVCAPPHASTPSSWSSECTSGWRRGRGTGRSTTRSSSSVRTGPSSPVTASWCRRTPSGSSGAPAMARVSRRWPRPPGGSARSSAGSTGCRSPARPCTNRPKRSTSPAGRPCATCTRSPAGTTPSRAAVSSWPPV